MQAAAGVSNCKCSHGRVIRKNFDREEVESIISPAVETLTAYVVQDEELKQQLLQSIDKRGY